MENETVEQKIVGLTTEEVNERIAQGKVNGDQNIKTKSVGKILFTNTFTFFNLLFIVIAIILFCFPTGRTSDYADFGFVGVLVTNWLIGVIQEIKAKKTIDKLSLLSAPKVTVVRDGEEKEIAIKDIVLDDWVVLSAGRQICADSVVTEGYIEVNESLITGEPDAIQKQQGDELLSGSFVVSGRAAAKVIHIGKDNYATKISSGAKYIKTFPSEIRRTLTKFIKIMGALIVPIGIALFCVKYFLQPNPGLNETIRKVMGTLIGMIPSGLVTLTSAIFCVSVIKLAKRKALAQDLYVVETLARVDVLCLDKTGTLTEGNMLVEQVVPREIVDFGKILKSIVVLTGDNNVTAEAIKEYYASETPFPEADRTIAFSSKYKFSAIEREGKTYVLGAPDFILKTGYEDAKEKIAEFGAKGLRTLVLAETPTFEGTDLPDECTLLAIVVLRDKIRREAPDTLRFFREQGVDIKIISGDNPVTVSCIAEKAGVANAEKYVDASTLTTEEEMDKALDECTVFGRTTPDQKLTLVKLLRKKGHTVGMTGDGVNDVLALRESDCSIAMASGSDAAKNVSQLVLLDSNFASLPQAVAEGRKTINNLERSASLYLVKTLYNVLFAIIFLIVSADLPFTPGHMTFIGTFTIGIPSVVLALEPNHELVKGRFFRKIITRAIPVSVTVAVCVLTATLVANNAGLHLTTEELSTVCVIIVGFIGFMYIAKISYPFNLWRIALLVVLMLCFTGAFFVRIGPLDLPKIFRLSTVFSHDMIVILAAVGGGSLPLFIGLIFLVAFLDKQFGDKIVAKFDRYRSKEKKQSKVLLFIKAIPQKIINIFQKKEKKGESDHV